MKTLTIFTLMASSLFNLTVEGTPAMDLELNEACVERVAARVGMAPKIKKSGWNASLQAALVSSTHNTQANFLFKAADDVVPFAIKNKQDRLLAAKVLYSAIQYVPHGSAKIRYINKLQQIRVRLPYEVASLQAELAYYCQKNFRVLDERKGHWRDEEAMYYLNEADMRIARNDRRREQGKKIEENSATEITKLLKKAVDLGLPEAQAQLAFNYKYAIYVESNHAQALELIFKMLKQDPQDFFKEIYSLPLDAPHRESLLKKLGEDLLERLDNAKLDRVKKELVLEMLYEFLEENELMDNEEDVVKHLKQLWADTRWA